MLDISLLPREPLDLYTRNDVIGRSFIDNISLIKDHVEFAHKDDSREQSLVRRTSVAPSLISALRVLSTVQRCRQVCLSAAVYLLEPRKQCFLASTSPLYNTNHGFDPSPVLALQSLRQNVATGRSRNAPLDSAVVHARMFWRDHRPGCVDRRKRTRFRTRRSTNSALATATTAISVFPRT